MAKRMSVKYVGNSHYSGMATVPEGTEFKAVAALDIDGNTIGVHIRGSNLAKASGTKDIFPAKQYLFAIGQYATPNEMELI